MTKSLIRIAATSLTFMFISPLSSAHAQDGQVQDLLQCDQIKDSEDRLACFNTIVEKLKEDPDSFHEQRRESEGKKPDFKRRYSGDDAFGRSSKYYQEATPDRITSGLKRYWKNARGRYTFYLDNGQIWQETSGSSLSIPNKPTNVIIKKGLFGSYSIKIKNTKYSGRSGKVKRVD
ncbi:hypothetical protein [Kordiimonas sp. SCSIO 12610]|uniref:hypothetical protein n=1 Tax=Kordiimonas sp. SCSIO 12610 TaxID=2829597 RepID=UPI00210D7B30|nr:hypothetical protein [Kordiimonas sp. SCSIO 12610]UTW55752.1 hypothetical protein KFF44_02360 [Kordiimonas sp. SCSIO 12610]